MDITVYLPDEIGQQAKEADLPFSRLLRAAVQEELTRRQAQEKTLEDLETFELILEDRDGRGYMGRLVGKMIAYEDRGLGGQADVYLTEDGRVLVHDHNRGMVEEIRDPQEELRSWLSPGMYTEAMDALGLRAIVNP